MGAAETLPVLAVAAGRCVREGGGMSLPSCGGCGPAPDARLLKSTAVLASMDGMTTGLIEIRRARPQDAPSLAEVHDAAWRTAYRGLIPGLELERMIERRGPKWWQSAIRRGSRISVLLVGDEVAGYTNYGGNRAKNLPFGGEIYEIYLKPVYQGPRLWTTAVFGRAARSLARRPAGPRGVGAVRQSRRHRLLRGPGWTGGRSLHRTLWWKSSGQNGFRLAAVAPPARSAVPEGWIRPEHIWLPHSPHVFNASAACAPRMRRRGARSRLQVSATLMRIDAISGRQEPAP